MESNSTIHHIRRKISQPFRRYKPPTDDEGGEDKLSNMVDFKRRERSNTVADISHHLLPARKSSDPKTKIQNLTNTIFVGKINKERIHRYKTFKILVLGIQNVGKTSIIKRFVNGEFTDEYLPTISEEYEAGIFLEIDDKLKQFDLVFKDFSGEMKNHYSELYREEIQNADGFILVHTKEVAESFPETLEMVADIRSSKRHLSILVMENKSEAKSHFDDIRVTRRSFNMDGVLNAAVSAKDNTNISESIALLIKDIDKNNIGLPK